MSLNDLADWLESCGYQYIAEGLRNELHCWSQEQINYLHKTLANYPNPLKILAGIGKENG
jgi:hypothetical protein